jgi:hypothetical protein
MFSFRFQKNPIVFVAALSILLGLAFGVQAQTKPSTTKQTHKETKKMHQAHGTFEVTVTPQTVDNKPAETAQLGRMSIDKVFSGELEATSTGEMLFAGTETEGSGGYVAIERVRGTLNGKTGTFVLQHLGTMTKNEPIMKVTVLPDSGTSQLAGIAGTMTIKIENGKHSFEFAYTLP